GVAPHLDHGWSDRMRERYGDAVVTGIIVGHNNFEFVDALEPSRERIEKSLEDLGAVVRHGNHRETRLSPWLRSVVAAGCARPRLLFALAHDRAVGYSSHATTHWTTP